MTIEEVRQLKTLEEWLEKGILEEYPQIYSGKAHINRYKDTVSVFKNYPVEMGAMVKTVEDWMQKTSAMALEINAIEDVNCREDRLNSLFEDDPMIFLNRHDSSHTEKVMEKALEIIKRFSRMDLTSYEIYFLLCAIVVHDVGNIYGRSGHEKRISDILDTECKSTIPDAVERRTISRIAGVHGGKIYGNSDTICALQEEAPVNGFTIREQLLASILRFADELADDVTRANYDALNSGIITDASQIYHVYSSSLHTVEIKENPISHSCEVFLAYQFNSGIAKTLYGKAGQQRYLVDEIYARTLKMERERRYCIRYLHSYITLERIKVSITITDPRDVFRAESITYTLEEKGYPSIPYVSIKDVDSTILTGKEMMEKLEKEGM